MSTNFEALEQVIGKLKYNFDETNKHNIERTNEVLYSIDLFENICNAIKKNSAIDVLIEAQSDLFNSLIFCFQGYYRYAYVCLRSSIELVLSFLYYSDHQYDFILWKNDCIDMTWSQLINTEKGVFNSDFLSIINGEPIKVESVLRKFKELYHVTSQYVHGKYDYMQKSLNDKIEYSTDLSSKYFDVCIDILDIEELMLYMRFKNEINEFVDSDSLIKIINLMKKYEVKNNG